MTDNDARKITKDVESVLPENCGFVLIIRPKNINDIGICGNIQPDDVMHYLKKIIEAMEERKANGNTEMNIHDI